MVAPVIGLADRLGNFTSLTVTKSHATLQVANNHKRGKTKALTALHHFGDAVDVHELV